MQEREQQGTSPGAPPARIKPARADMERMLGLVLEAAGKWAGNWFEAADAAEVAQDIGLNFWVAWQADPWLFDPDVVPLEWISTAVRNAAVDRLRAAETRAFADVESDPERDESIESDADPAAQVEAFELERDLAEALNLLPPRQRHIWLRVRDLGMGYDEIAAEFKISRETVKRHMARAIHVLRNAHVRYEGGQVDE